MLHEPQEMQPVCGFAFVTAGGDVVAYVRPLDTQRRAIEISKREEGAVCHLKI